MEDEMKCIECGDKVTTSRENFRHEALGLPVTLVGVEVSRCAACGLSEVSIPALEGLHRTIAVTLVTKTARLCGPEIRFLRKQLGWSGAELAEHLGITRETVSRWEQGSAPIGATADRLLRATFALATGLSLSTETLREIARDEPVPFAPRFRHQSIGWKAEVIELEETKRSRRASSAR
jgi:putative zinc finger/helix-turn-helix YgiT family protein